MTVVTQPNLIEMSDFRGGWAPDGEDTTTEPDTLVDVLNLLPDLNTGSLQVRKGFRRIREELAALPDHYVKHVFHFRVPSEQYLIVVVTDASTNANNVRLYAIKLSDLTVARMDTAGTTWSNSKAAHWGIGIDTIWYGGSRGNEMYSWDPSGPTWNATAATGNWKDWAAQIDDDVDLTTEYPKDYAWTGHERVYVGSSVYTPARDIRYTDYVGDEDQHYHKGDKVSRKATWDTTNSYYKSFRCIDAHVANDVDKRPGTGADTAQYWEKIKLDGPVDDDSDTSKDWFFVPVAAETSVAAWHSDRMFMRYDDQGDKSRVLYSAPIRAEKGEDVPDTEFDPKNFAPASTTHGAGGGWLSFNDGKHGGEVTAMHSYGQYLLVFKRRALWALSGSGESTWNNRRVAQGVGAVSGQSVVEYDGLVYFLSDDGLYVTDGTTVEPAQGNEKVQVYMRDRMDALLPNLDLDPSMWVYDGFIWMTLPDTTESVDGVTIVYDPRTGSFWYTDLPIADAVTYRVNGISKMAFGAISTYATEAGPLIFEYGKSNDSDQDDTGVDTYAGADIPWHLQTAWWNFGTMREDRRIRRVWASVRAVAQTFTLYAYRNWSTSAETTTSRVSSTTTPQFIEGEWVPDAHAIQLKLAGTKRTAVITGLAVDTEPRRTRYHT